VVWKCFFEIFVDDVGFIEGLGSYPIRLQAGKCGLSARREAGLW